MLRIADVIEEQGRRKDWLARKLGISPALLSQMLRGQRRWNEERRRLAVEALGIEADEELFRPVGGLKCPLCGGRGSVERGDTIVRCNFCLGLGKVTRQRLEDVVGAKFVPEGMV